MPSRTNTLHTRKSAHRLSISSIRNSLPLVLLHYNAITIARISVSTTIEARKCIQNYRSTDRQTDDISDRTDVDQDVNSDELIFPSRESSEVSEGPIALHYRSSLSVALYSQTPFVTPHRESERRAARREKKSAGLTARGAA